MIVVVAALLAAVGWRLLQRPSERPQTRPSGKMPVAVEVAEAKRTTLSEERSFTGSLYPISQFIVAPKIAGRLERLHVKIGDMVTRGQLIAELESDEYLRQVDQARAELEVANATLAESRSSLAVAARELERVRTLRQKRIASESELDAAEAQFTAQEAKNRVAAAQVVQKEAALKAAEVRLSYTRIRASWEDGGDSRLVGERYVDEGAMLAANTSIVSVLDTSVLIAVIHVIEKDYPRITPGQQAELDTDALPGRLFTGKVVRIAPLLKETTRTGRVELEVPNAQGLLRPGMFVRVKIRFATIENALCVPIEALVKRREQSGVFVLQEGLSRFIPVKQGITAGGLVQVLEPEIKGPVVVLGHHLLEDGSAVIISEKARASRPEAPGPAQKTGPSP